MTHTGCVEWLAPVPGYPTVRPTHSQKEQLVAKCIIPSSLIAPSQQSTLAKVCPTILNVISDDREGPPYVIEQC